MEGLFTNEGIMPEAVIYENGELTDFSRELPLTEEQRDAILQLAQNQEDNDYDFGNVTRIIVDMDY
jgi:hypothetical protein